MKQIYLILAALLLLRLAPMPYGYYMLVRFVMMVAFAAIAYHFFQQEKTELAWAFGALALLFQPFMKIALGRMVWNIVAEYVAANPSCDSRWATCLRMVLYMGSLYRRLNLVQSELWF